MEAHWQQSKYPMFRCPNCRSLSPVRVRATTTIGANPTYCGAIYQCENGCYRIVIALDGMEIPLVGGPIVFNESAELTLAMFG